MAGQGDRQRDFLDSRARERKGEGEGEGDSTHVQRDLKDTEEKT